MQSPPCLIMLGGLGDVLIALTIAKHYADLHGAPVPFLTSARYQNLLSGCSYVKPVGYTEAPWRAYSGAIEWARARYEHVLPLHVGEPEICSAPRTSRFCHEQFLHAGVEGRYGEFPLVFDRRNPSREAALIARVRGSDPRPLFLYNLAGRSSPFAGANALLSALRAKWGARAHLVNISALDLSHFQDLLGLLDASVGMLSIDTSTIHLMPASSTPYVALVNDTKSPWWSSVPRGKCVLELGYTEALAALPLIHDTIAEMLASGVSGTVSPVQRRDIDAFLATAPRAAVTGGKPHLITLACNGMEKVWRVAEKTWNPWCAAHSLERVQCVSKAPRADLAPSWNKIPLVLEALESHSEVWWVDSDITVARPDASLPSSDADLLFASDWNGLCAAMFRARATEWTRAFLRAVLLLGDVHDPDAFGKGCGIKWEQNVFKALLASFPSCGKHVELLPDTFLNDRPAQGTIAPPFTASFNHFGALSNTARIRAIQKKHSL